MTALEHVEWGACLLEPRRDRALERALRREARLLPPMVPYFEGCPWLAQALVAFRSLRPAEVDSTLVDVIVLVVSQDQSCRYCYAGQRVFMRAQGASEAHIRQLEENFEAAELDEPRRAALDFARRTSRASPPPGAKDREKLRAVGWSEPATCEIAVAAAMSVFFNRVATIPALPVLRIERIAQHWLIGLLAPILRLGLRSLRRQGTHEPLPPELRGGPFARLVTRLDGLPAAPILRRTLDAAFDSSLLSRRAKALVFAVVARGLGCPHSAHEAAELLAAEGLSPSEIQETLEHLGSSALDPLEARLVPFARETIRYEPIQVQRHAGALAERLGTAQLVELIGIAALANALGRLWLALDAP